MKSRIISGAVAIGYLVIAYYGGGPGAVLKFAVALILPLACIWYGDALGEYIGGFGRATITSTSPGCLVAFLGWVLLLGPIIYGVIAYLTGNL